MTDTEKISGNISALSSSTQSLKITWKIPEFFSLPETTGFSLDSPSFMSANAKWCIRLYPNGKKDVGWCSRMEIFVVRLHSLVSCHAIICKFDIITENGAYFNDSDIYEKFLYDENCKLRDMSDAGDLPKRSTLAENKKTHAPDGTLVLEGHLIFEDTAKGSEFFSNVSNKVDSNWTLCQDFKNLLLEGENHDLTLKVKDKEFRAHRSVLIARCQVFQSMLTHDMMEKNSGVIDVPDCEPEAMEQLLLYLYCGEVENLNKNNMLSLYYAADKYNLKFLREGCCEFIKKSLSPSNICDVVELAMNHSDRGLLESATDYFVDNTKRILTTTEWLTFMKENSVAANELLIETSKKWTR